MINPSDLDPVIHVPARLGVMTALSQHDRCDFKYLKTTLDVSDGNLSTHMTKLKTVGYIDVKKQFKNNMPHTSYALTTKGRAALSAYLKQLKQLIQVTDL